MAIVKGIFRKVESVFEQISWGLWVLVLLSIPITSFPLVGKFTGDSSVSPLAGIPLFLLLGFWLLPYILKNRPISKIAVPFLAFVGVALISSFRAPFLEIYPFKGITLFSREIRSMITLGMGVAFYLVAATLPHSKQRLRKSFQWLYIGAFIMLLWSTVQIFRLPYSYNPQPEELNAIHRLFSLRDLFRDRVTGMAYEPSWLADQLSILYLPVLLASIIKKTTVFNIRWKAITIELVLFLWGGTVLFFTFSRIGLLAFITAVGVLLIASSRGFISTFAEKRSQGSRLSVRQVKGLTWAGLSLLLLMSVLLIFFLATQSNARLSDLLRFDLKSIFESNRLPALYNLANNLEYAERLLYWISAFLIFSRFPILGVGLGNSGLLFRETVPAFGNYLPEILHILGPVQVTIANPKSLWLRLLAETGILGFMVFITWLLILALVVHSLSRSRKDLLGVIGLAGAMTLIVQFFEGFSLDTFALPQLWIMLGFVTSAWMILPAEIELEQRE